MGNREDLLAGAQRVILDTGVAKATARDIATEAGVSLAAIGYHFGSKDTLVADALSGLLGNGIDSGVEQLLCAHRNTTPLASIAHLIDHLPELFTTHRTTVWASMENTVRLLRESHGREDMTAAILDGYRATENGLRAAHPELNDDQLAALANVVFVIVQGMSMLWLALPEDALPDGDIFSSAISLLHSTATPSAPADPASRLQADPEPLGA